MKFHHFWSFLEKSLCLSLEEPLLTPLKKNPSDAHAARLNYWYCTVSAVERTKIAYFFGAFPFRSRRSWPLQIEWLYSAQKLFELLADEYRS